MTDVGIEAARATRREWSWLRLPLGLALALGAVAALEASPLWAALREGVASLDFDPVRTAMIAGWIGCLAAALLGGALAGRPWASVLAATAFLAATFAAPWGWHAVNGAPVVFGTRENLDALALARQLATILAAGFLLAVPGAAAGSLLSTTALALVRRLRRPDRTLLAVSVALTALLASLLLAAGIAPLLRYGPAHGLYTPRTSGKPPPAGQLLAGTFHSTAMGQDRPFAVYLPASYGKQPQRRYPVVYLLHGDPGSYRDWGNLGVTTTCDAGIAYGALPETIVAMPDGNGSVYRAAQWATSWDGRDRVEASVMELVGLIDREYRTVPDRRHRVVAGLSEGGFGAANLAARHPAVFGVAISLSGYFSAQGPVFGDNAAYRRANSPSSIVRDEPAARSVSYIVAAGDQDQRYLKEAQAFADELDRLHVRHELFLITGGHEGGVWTSGLVLGLQRVKSQLESRPS